MGQSKVGKEFYDVCKSIKKKKKKDPYREKKKEEQEQGKIVIY